MLIFVSIGFSAFEGIKANENFITFYDENWCNYGVVN